MVDLNIYIVNVDGPIGIGDLHCYVVVAASEDDALDGWTTLKKSQVQIELIGKADPKFEHSEVLVTAYVG